MFVFLVSLSFSVSVPGSESSVVGFVVVVKALVVVVVFVVGASVVVASGLVVDAFVVVVIVVVVFGWESFSIASKVTLQRSNVLNLLSPISLVVFNLNFKSSKHFEKSRMSFGQPLIFSRVI